jgi:hypothetical protein
MGPRGLAAIFDAAEVRSRISCIRKIRDGSPGGKFAMRISCKGEPASPNQIIPNLITASRTRFAAVENRQASNYVKEKHPIKRTVLL